MAHTLSFCFSLILALTLLAPPRAASASPDAWFDAGWPYRIRVDIAGSGVASAAINFTTQFNALGLNHALLDLRSVRVVPYNGATPGAPVPYAESYSTMLNDGESTAGWSVNDAGYVALDTVRKTQGASSLRATVTNTLGGYGYPGFELHPTTINNWSQYESLIYDVWPEVNASALDQAPDLYWFKLYNACGGSAVTQGAPALALDRWNYASVSLNPLSACWPPALNLSSITRMEFHTRDNVTGDTQGPNGWYDDGDVLTLRFDNMRLVDQDNGALRWQTVAGATSYYIYFDTLTHEGHAPPQLASLGAATLTGTPATSEAGGYYQQISGTVGAGSLAIWAAPTVEKILKTMAPPVSIAPLHLSAARGEFEPFQVVVRSPVSQTLPVSISAFVAAGATITTTMLHRVDYVNITTMHDQYDRTGWWPDPLWPLNNGEGVIFPASVNQPLWFTVRVPWNAPASVYTATVHIGGASVPVALQVFDFSLPRQTHLLSEWGFDWSSVVETYHGTSGSSVQACYWNVVDAMKQDFANHRLTPKGVAWPAGLNYPGGIDYDCNGTLSPASWGQWGFADLAGKYAHGEQGFNGGYGFPSFLALGPTDNNPPDSLPYSFCGINRSGVLGSPAYQAKWTQYLGALDSYIVSANYASQAYYHIVNEPQTLAQYTADVGPISALTHAAAPHLRQMLSEQVEPAIYNYPGAKIDIWMPTISNYEPAKSHDRQKNHGESVWWYYLYGDDPPLPNPILMSHPGVEARLTPWLAWAERVDGLLHYSTTDWSANPWTTPNVTGQDNGDGFFFYPPRKDNMSLTSCNAPTRLVPSIRWENLRDGMEDYEYLWLLSGKPQIDASNRADGYVAQIVQSRTRFSHVPTDLDATRTALATALSGWGQVWLPLMYR